MKIKRIGTLACFSFCLSSLLSAASMEDLTPVKNPEQLAPGIWKLSIGDVSKELRYTDHAAAPPRMEVLNEKVDTPYPFADNPISFYVSPDKRISVRIPADTDESIYGFGLQLDGIKKSKKVLNLNVDHWGKGNGRTHAPVPFYISSKGYGVFFNTARFLKAYVLCGNRKDSPNLPEPVDRNPVTRTAKRWTALPDSDAVEAHIVGNGLEVMIFSGESLLDIVSRYNLYNGGGAMPPLWGLGFWNRTKASYNESDCDADIKRFEEEGFPLDVLGLEPGWMTMSYPCTFEWQKERFPNPGAFSQKLLDQGIRLNLWVNPYISPEAKLYEPMYPLSGSHTVWLGIVPDYTLPEARRLLAEQHQREHVDIGVSGYKIDEVDGYDQWLWPDHATFPSGTSAEAVRQAYGVLLQNTTYNDLFKKHNTRTYGLIRSSNGGASGYPYVLYSDSYNHEQYITGLSAASLSGILWTPEVRQAANDREWLNRFHVVCFSPLAMLNAWSSGKKPWDYADVTDEVRKTVELRMRLLPYLYTAFSEYNRKGVPPIRAMILEDGYAEKKAVTQKAKLDDVRNPYEMVKTVQKTNQYMFGPSIMVAPFYNQYHSERTVQLPEGDWYDFYTGELVGSNTTITVNAEGMENHLPLFVKDGALIPMLTKPVMNTRDAYGQKLEVRHYGKKDGEFTLYEDDGKTFDYEEGVFRLRQLTMAEGAGNEKIIRDKAPAMFGPVTQWTTMNK
ncbi:MAG: TIM-barrel domain-containing protein [Verrucomicrobiota bacterium]